jgi:hypothetical protein
MDELRVCAECGDEKPLTLQYFRSEPRLASRLARRCRVCDNTRAKAYYAANRERCKARSRAWIDSNPERAARYRAVYAAGGRAKAEYKIACPEKARAARRKYKRAYKRLHPPTLAERIMRRVRGRTTKALGGKIGDKLAGRWLGCTPAELKVHIERQFVKGMTWENRSAWHVDHILPLSSFDLTDPEQRARACHFTNLRPLWSEDNMRKAARREHLL